jgi:hypothetical protein
MTHEKSGPQHQRPIAIGSSIDVRAGKPTDDVISHADTWLGGVERMRITGSGMSVSSPWPVLDPDP